MLYWFKYLRMKSFLSVGVYDNQLLAPATWEPLDEATTFQGLSFSSGSIYCDSWCTVSSH